LLTSIGAASGSAGLYSGVIIGAVIWALVFCLNRINVPGGKYLQETYTVNGKEKTRDVTVFVDEHKNQLTKPHWRFQKINGERMAIARNSRGNDVYLDDKHNPMDDEKWDFRLDEGKADDGRCAPKRDNRDESRHIATSKTDKNEFGMPVEVNCQRKQIKFFVWHLHNPDWIVGTDAKRHNREIHEKQEEQQKQIEMQERVKTLGQKTEEIDSVKDSVLASMAKIDAVHNHLIEEEKVHIHDQYQYI